MAKPKANPESASGTVAGLGNPARVPDRAVLAVAMGSSALADRRILGVADQRIAAVAFPVVAFPAVAFPAVALPVVAFLVVAFPAVALPAVALPVVALQAVVRKFAYYQI